MTATILNLAIFEGVHAVHKASNTLSPKFAAIGIGTLTLTDNAGQLDLGGASLTGSALAAGYLLVGNLSGVAAPVALSGDATLTAGGVITISALSVGTSKIANGAITKAKLDDSVAGAGLQRSGLTQQIEANPDQTTLTIGLGLLKVKDSGIDTTQLAGNAVTSLKLSPGLRTELANHEDRIVTLEAQVAGLLAAIAAIQANVPAQFISTSTAAQTQVVVTGFTFDASNLVLDLDVDIDGRGQTQDSSGGTTQSYRKLNATTIEFSDALAAGKRIRVFKRGTTSGPAVNQIIGSADLTNITVPVAPITNGAEALGQPAKGWSSLFLKDSANAQVYELIIVNNQVEFNPV